MIKMAKDLKERICIVGAGPSGLSAAYVLKYLDWETMNSFIRKDLLTWKKGTQEVWKELSYRLNKKPRLCTKINKVRREDDKVYVYTEFGREEYDKIIFTSPLQDLHLYVDVTEEEEELFSKIKYEDYKVFACTVENYPTISGYIPGNMMQSRAGHTMVYYHRWENEPEQIVTMYVLGDPQERVGVKEARQLVEEDLETLGMNLIDIVMHKSWRYFPHVNCDELKHGWYDKVEGMQGELGTYYAGEVMNFGNIDECVAYSKLLVNRFF
ncbi:hypothetical protein FYJ27_11485 [Anaerosalibacter bizertensis]|uniref:Amine oxidase domain-containing protein n=2 Tax=Anaerosalibacter bizertensis TaxID=932217 RepID=A0A844FK53_9FIRM|nr:hypothetical protein [Anaerosalibacter bizertensis]